MSVTARIPRGTHSALVEVPWIYLPPKTVQGTDLERDTRVSLVSLKCEDMLDATRHQTDASARQKVSFGTLIGTNGGRTVEVDRGPPSGGFG